MSNTPELVLVGGGNMGSALVGGLVASGMDPRTITVVEIDAAKRSDLAARFGVVTSAGINSTVLGSLAKNSVRYGRTVHLSQKYGLPLPANVQRSGAAGSSD